MRLISLLIAASFFASCATAGGASSASRPAVASSTPDFSLPSVSGKQVRLSPYIGKKAVLMNFWATWCGPCTQELPHLQALYDKYKDSGFVVLAIAMDGPESSAGVEPFVRSTGLTFPVLLDEEGRAANLYNTTRRAPFNVFIDKNGKVVGEKEGYEAGDDEVIERMLQAMLNPVAP